MYAQRRALLRQHIPDQISAEKFLVVEGASGET